jgi:hypothetical protein
MTLMTYLFTDSSWSLYENNKVLVKYFGVSPLSTPLIRIV